MIFSPLLGFLFWRSCQCFLILLIDILEGQAVGLLFPPPFVTVILPSSSVSGKTVETLGLYFYFYLTFCNN
jgi:hypothetical protein